MNLIIIVLASLVLFIFLLFHISFSMAALLLVIIVLVLLAVYKSLVHFFNIDVLAKISAVFMPQFNTSQLAAEVEVNEMYDDSGLGSSSSVLDASSSNTIPEIRIKPQVFNIPGNEYTYIDAKALCKAYGARLATYAEVENAYDKGGEWCNYGWSDEQMALFPTQMKTFQKLRRIKGHEHDCGRPGVNGGYIKNPNVRFGANCFGFKPQITTTEEEMMKNMVPYPKSMEDVLMEQKVDYYKGQLNNTLVSPFNYEYWSKLLTV